LAFGSLMQLFNLLTKPFDFSSSRFIVIDRSSSVLLQHRAPFQFFG
jgi:hypothetical protein